MTGAKEVLEAFDEWSLSRPWFDEMNGLIAHDHAVALAAALRETLEALNDVNDLQRIIVALVHQSPERVVTIADATLEDMDTDVVIRTLHDPVANASHITTSAQRDVSSGVSDQ